MKFCYRTDLSPIKAGMSQKNKIGYVAPPEPKFIREMKAKLGYQYQDNLDTKLDGDAGDFDDREGDLGGAKLTQTDFCSHP